MPDTPRGSAATERDACNDSVLAIVCPMCGWSRYGHLYGPTYKPRRWFRRTAFWRCTWCKYEWEDAEDGT